MNPSTYQAKHFLWSFDRGVGTITFNRPERKNPLTFESYAELRDLFRALAGPSDVRAILITGAGGNFCSGGDVHEIIGPLLAMSPAERHDFTRMTGDLVGAMLSCSPVVIAAIDGVCVGAGAAIAMASDLRIGTGRSRVAFLFVRVGLAGCDMGACALLPRIVGQGRAAELLFTGRTLNGEEAERWGFYNRSVEPAVLSAEATDLARSLAEGPAAAHRVTKRQLLAEWDMPLLAAIEMEAREQALLMATQDFRRAYDAFVRREAPRFAGD